MGSEDFFHKRKARKGTELERLKKDRSRSPRYLIVCEGTKTEPHYFREILDDLKIRPQSVRIAPNEGNSPDRVVAHALSVYDNDALSGDSFDKVFCVFDRDTHETFDAAVQRVSDLKSSAKPRPFEAITSTPCFEFWFLLHFGFTDQPFHRSGKKSIGDKVVAVLRSKPGFNAYGKGKRGTYTELKDKMASAIESAEKLRKCSVNTGHSNPATNVDLLVLALQSLEPAHNNASHSGVRRAR